VNHDNSIGRTRDANGNLIPFLQEDSEKLEITMSEKTSKILDIPQVYKLPIVEKKRPTPTRPRNKPQNPPSNDVYVFEGKADIVGTRPETITWRVWKKMNEGERRRLKILIHGDNEILKEYVMDLFKKYPLKNNPDLDPNIKTKRFLDHIYIRLLFVPEKIPDAYLKFSDTDQRRRLYKRRILAVTTSEDYITLLETLKRESVKFFSENINRIKNENTAEKINNIISEMTKLFKKIFNTKEKNLTFGSLEEM
jgi:arsenate reductase-like glutaredoxin family protein